MRKNTKIVAAIVAAVVVVLVVVAAGAMGGKGMVRQSSAGSNTSATATNMVNIKDYMFTPAIVKVKVGTTVTWTNQDAVSHTITADNPSGDAPSSMDIAQGKSYSFTFKKAGTYTYHCFPHPYMHGTVEVTNS